MSQQEYTFNLEVLTIADFVALAHAIAANDTAAFLTVVARCAPADIFAHPMREIPDILGQFVTAYLAFSVQMQASADDASTPEATRILRKMFGEGTG